MRTVLPLHDAEFNGIVVKDRSADLFFVALDGKAHIIHLAGIDALHMDNFREGNIAILFEAISVELDLQAVEWERLYSSPHSSAAPEYRDKHDEFLRLKRNAIEQGHLTFVRMASAYGADLLALCAKVEMQDG